jgi:hypothetical protein
MEPDPSDQLPPMLPQVGTSDFDWRPSTLRPEREIPLSPTQQSGGPADGLDPPHTPNPGAGDDDNQQGDGDALGHGMGPNPGAGDDDTQQGDGVVWGRIVQPDDVPGGPNDQLPDDLVPHLEALWISTEFINQIRLTSLDNDPIPLDAHERLRSPTMEPPYIDADLRMLKRLD